DRKARAPHAQPRLVAVLGVVAPVLYARARLFPRRDVEAGAERPAGAGNDQRPDVVVALAGVHGGAEVGEQLIGEGVHLLRAVQGEDGERAVLLELDRGVGHGGPLFVDVKGAAAALHRVARRDGGPTRPAAPSDDRDGFHLDEPAGHGQRGDADQGGGGGPLAEELLADCGQLGAVPDVDEEGGELDDVGERAAARFDLGLQGAERRARLGGEIARMPGLALLVVVDLARDEQDGLRAADLDGLAVGGWVEHALGCDLFDLCCHGELSFTVWVQMPAGGRSRGSGGARPPARARATSWPSWRRSRACRGPAPALRGC